MPLVILLLIIIIVIMLGAGPFIVGALKIGGTIAIASIPILVGCVILVGIGVMLDGPISKLNSPEVHEDNQWSKRMKNIWFYCVLVIGCLLGVVLMIIG